MDKSKFNDRNEWRKFGIVLGGILLVIAAVQFFKQMDIFIWFAASGMVVELISFIIPVILKPVFILFMYFGFVMNWLITRIILSLLFYLVVTPVGLISRQLGKPFLNLNRDKKTDSYWQDVAPERNDPKSFEQQF